MKISEKIIKDKKIVVSFRLSYSDLQKLDNGETLEISIKGAKFELKPK